MLEYEAGLRSDDEKSHDILEVLNYRKALSLAADALERGPIDLQLIL